MLTAHLQIQILANRLAGLPDHFKTRHFSEPWKTCWLALESAPPGQAHDALTAALQQLPDPYQPDVVLDAILQASPGALLGDHRSLQDLSAELSPIRWIWPGWVPRGMITLLGAVPGAGKSFLSLDLARRIIHGLPFPDGQPCPRPDGAAVLYVDAEAVPQILNERALNWGMDRTRLFPMLPESLGILDFGAGRDQERLVELVADLQPELIVIDSLSSISTKGENNVEDIRLVLAFLNRLVQEFQVGLILIHHLRKSSPQLKLWDISIDDFRGSSHILAISRSVLGLSIVQTGPTPDRNGPRKLELIKTNLCAFPRPLGFEFAPLQPAGVSLRWGSAPQPFREPTRIEQCKLWLETVLRGGERRPADLVALGEADGYSRAVIYRARDELGSAIVNTQGKQHPQNAWKWGKDS